MNFSKYITLVFIIQFFLYTVSFAQREKIGSLQKKLLTAKDTQRINCLNALSKTYLEIEQDTALLFAASAFYEAQRLQYVQGMADAVLNSGKAEVNKGNDSAARNFFLRAIPLYGKCNNTDMLGSAYLNLGITLRDSAALKAYEKADQLFQKVKDSGRSSYAKTMMGLTYQAMGNYEKAFELAYQSLQIGEKTHDHYRVLYSLSNLGRLFQEVEDYPAAIDYYSNQPLDYARKNKIKWFGFYDKVAEVYFSMHQYDSALYFLQKYLLSSSDSASLKNTLSDPKTIDFNVGRIFLIRKEYDKALRNFLGALKNAEAKKNSNEQMEILNYTVQTYMAKGQYENALQYSRNLLTLAQNTVSRVNRRDATQFLWKIYDHQKSLDSAYKYYRQYAAMKDSVTSYRFLTQLTSFKQSAVNEKKELQYQQSLQQASLTKKALLIGIIVILFISVFVFRFILLKRRNEANQKEILQKELSLQKLESEKTKAELQQQATELEMQALRAQMNPHFIFNSLNSINRFILQNNKTQASEYLTKFSKLVRMILQNSQASLISLESEIESLGLYLEMEALRFNYHFAYKISVPKDLDIEMLKVPPLIIQPYVENAIWHGLMHKEEKGQLDIEVWLENNYVFFKITDDGIGRKKATELASKSATKHKSMGLRITADRIAMMQSSNGTESPVTITDLVNADGTAAGTEVIIKMPVINS